MSSQPISGAPAAQDPKELWAALAPTLAARGRVRIARDRLNYTRRDERTISSELPVLPAAVLVYDQNGCAPALILDLDTSKGGNGAVSADLSAAGALLDRIGASWFSDHSPNGGHHIYVPLRVPIALHEAKSILARFSVLLPTLDPLPMASVSSGCIRPPGAAHRSGGHQILDGVLADASRALLQPTSPQTFARLVQALPATPERHQSSANAGERLTPLRGWSQPDSELLRIAREGDGWQDRYESPSEARQGVLWAAAASGWALVDVVRRIENGTWRGLASLYARYSPGHRRKALASDWHNAVAHEKQRRENGRNKSVRVRPTSGLKTQGGASGATTINQVVREWLTAVDLLHGPETDLSLRAVLYALAEAAVLTESMEIEHGNRSLAIGTGLNQRTVGRALQLLAALPRDRALIDQIQPAAGTRAAVYQLVVPDLLQPACAAKPWRRGRVYGIRPVFRELGLCAAFVYAALEQAETPMGGRELAAAARLSPSATYEALKVLASWGLADRVEGGWSRGRVCLRQLAEAWGVLDSIRAELERYRVERRAWWAWLVRNTNVVPFPPSPAEAPPPDDWWPDPDPSLSAETSLELLHRILGAHVLDETA